MIDPCIILIPSLSTVAVVANVSMVIHIFKANNASFQVHLIFKLLGLSNVSCGICLILQWIANASSMSILIVWILSAALAISFFLQMAFNVSLAFVRYQFVINALDYFTSQSKRRLEKKLSIAVFTSALVLGIICAIMRILINNIQLIAIPIAISRTIGYILLCIFYIKLYFAMKSQNQAVVARSAGEGQPKTNNHEVIAKRKKNLQHAKKFFTGIITSFFVLNIPSIIALFMATQFPNCKTWQGLFHAISIGLTCVNMVFDSIWYFYMERRSRRS